MNLSEAIVSIIKQNFPKTTFIYNLTNLLEIDEIDVPIRGLYEAVVDCLSLKSTINQLNTERWLIAQIDGNNVQFVKMLDVPTCIKDSLAEEEAEKGFEDEDFDDEDDFEDFDDDYFEEDECLTTSQIVADVVEQICSLYKNETFKVSSVRQKSDYNCGIRQIHIQMNCKDDTLEAKHKREELIRKIDSLDHISVKAYWERVKDASRLIVKITDSDFSEDFYHVELKKVLGSLGVSSYRIIRNPYDHTVFSLAFDPELTAPILQTIREKLFDSFEIVKITNNGKYMRVYTD